MVGLGVGGDGSNDGAHEFLVAGIVHIVVVGEIAGFFIITREVVFGMHGDALAIGAAIIALVFPFGVDVVELGWGWVCGLGLGLGFDFGRGRC